MSKATYLLTTASVCLLVCGYLMTPQKLQPLIPDGTLFVLSDTTVIQNDAQSLMTKYQTN